MIREPRVSEAEHTELLAFLRYKREVCSCGFHESLTEADSGNVFQPTSRVCPVCAGGQAYARDQAAQDQDWDTAHPGIPSGHTRPYDGRQASMRLVELAHIDDD